MTIDEQQQHLERVSSRIAQHILDFCAGHRTFNMDQLVAYVQEVEPGTAPDSSSRILRDLRRKGRVSYVVLDRRASLYRIVDEPTHQARQDPRPSVSELKARIAQLEAENAELRRRLAKATGNGRRPVNQLGLFETSRS